jgi:hypothetical protein
MELVKAFQVPKGPGGSNPLGGEAMVEKKVIMETQAEIEKIASEVAKKLLSAETLTEEEASLLRQEEFTGKLYIYLWHYTFAGW